MLTPRDRTPIKSGSILRGLASLVRFDANGIDAFDRGLAGVTASLAPVAAPRIVVTLLWLLQTSGPVSLASVLRAILPPVIGVLAPLAISHELARRWGRSALWPRYAAAFDWCSFLLATVAMVIGNVALRLTGSEVKAISPFTIFIIVLGLYALALEWFVARRGLAVSGLRAAAVVVLTNLLTAALTLLPTLLARWLAGSLT